MIKIYLIIWYEILIYLINKEGKFLLGNKYNKIVNLIIVYIIIYKQNVLFVISIIVLKLYKILKFVMNVLNNLNKFIWKMFKNYNVINSKC